MYISPPHTTGIHQALDQIFKSWHDTFNSIVKRWCNDHIGKELNKRIFTDIFAEAWGKWTGPDKIVAAFRHVGISVRGLDPAAVPRDKFVIASSVARPPPEAPTPAPALMPPYPTTPALMPPYPTTPALTGPQTRSGGLGAASSSAVAPASSAIDFELEWQSPSPEAGKYAPDSKEYWKAKAQMASTANRDLFAAGKKLHQTPVTLKDSHPAWQVRRASPTREDPALGTKRVKGAWGDMDSCEMLEKLDEQQREEEENRVAIAERKEARAEQKAAREAEAAQQKALREATVVAERPVTDLLQSLGFTAGQSDTINAGELSAFARANRAELVALGCDLSSLTKKTLMPQLIEKISAPNVTWKKAPPKALPAPPTAAPIVAPLALTDGMTADETTVPAAAPADDGGAAGGPAKRPRRAAAAPAQ